MEYPKCNLCGNKNSDELWKNVTTWEHKGKFNIVKCKNCGLIYLYPRPSIKQISKYYKKEDYWQNNESYNNRIQERESYYSPINNYIFNKIKRGRILDIGAGNGNFLMKFKEEGWQIEGVELSRVAANIAKKEFDIDLKVGDLFDYKYPKNYFDVVTMNNVLEHLYDPFKTLREIGGILREEGLLVITIPNIESIGALIFKKKWYPLQPPRHLYHFSYSTISKMLIENGFIIDKVNFNYRIHNFYHLYQSARFMLSPKFRKSKSGGFFIKESENKIVLNNLIKILGKITVYFFALTLTVIEGLSKKGEVFTLYIKKVERL